MEAAIDKPAPPPEAVLLAVARKAAGLKSPEVARAAGISKARLSQIETGYEGRLGGYRPVRGSDTAVAHVAAIVGVTPERLEEAGRPDAAVILREIRRREQEDQPAARPDPVAEEVRKIWGDHEPPDFIRVMAASPPHVADDDTKLRLIRQYAEQYPPPGYRPHRDQGHRIRSA